jgi:2-dehydropantoate 2-reductase
MHIAVLGAGAMGSVFGARLALGGAEVTLLDVNQAHVDAIARAGLQVDLDGVHHRLNLPAMRPDQFTGPTDLVLLFTKVFHTGPALASIAGTLGGATVLTLQNGIGNAERIAEYVPAERTILGLTMTPAEFLGPGMVASHGKATTTFYSADGQHRPLLDALVALMGRGGIVAKADPQIQAAIWEKAAFNCAMNAICALTDGTPGGIGSLSDALALAKSVAAEAIGVAQADGVPASIDKVTALIDHAAANHLLHEPSMLQDRKAGRRTEIDALCGAVAERGATLGLATPLNRTLATLVRLAEAMPAYRAARKAA